MFSSPSKRGHQKFERRVSSSTKKSSRKSSQVSSPGQSSQNTDLVGTESFDGRSFANRSELEVSQEALIEDLRSKNESLDSEVQNLRAQLSKVRSRENKRSDLSGKSSEPVEENASGEKDVGMQAGEEESNIEDEGGKENSSHANMKSRAPVKNLKPSDPKRQKSIRGDPEEKENGESKGILKENSLPRLSKDTEDLTNKNHALEQTVANLTKSLGENQDELRRLKSESKSLTEKAEALDLQLQQEAEEKKSFVTEAKELKAFLGQFGVDTSSHPLDELKRLLEKKEIERRQIQEALDKSSSELKTAGIEIPELTKKIETLEAELREMQAGRDHALCRPNQAVANVGTQVVIQSDSGIAGSNMGNILLMLSLLFCFVFAVKIEVEMDHPFVVPS